MTILRKKGWTHFKLETPVLHLCRKVDEGWEEAKIRFEELDSQRGWVLDGDILLRTTPPEGYSAITSSVWGKEAKLFRNKVAEFVSSFRGAHATVTSESSEIQNCQRDPARAQDFSSGGSKQASSSSRQVGQGNFKEAATWLANDKDDAYQKLISKFPSKPQALVDIRTDPPTLLAFYVENKAQNRWGLLARVSDTQWDYHALGQPYQVDEFQDLVDVKTKTANVRSYQMVKVSKILKSSYDLSDKFPPQLIALLDKLNSFGEFYLVGGCIRDSLLGRTPKDFDIMVVKPSPEELEKILPVQKVGASFPVYLYDTKDPVLGVIEFAYARKETKTGTGYKGFSVEVVDNVKEDLARRDLTINALAWSPQKGLVMFDDNSLDDLKNQKIKHVTEAFAEDPLRVMRACRFSSQLPGNWTIDTKTLEMMSSLKDELPSLASDRVKIELEKSLMSPLPGAFFENLQKADCTDYWFPEVSSQAISDLNTAAKQFDLVGMYCVLGQSMGQGIASFCKRLAIGYERDMQIWQKISQLDMSSPQDYLYVFKAGRQGKLGMDNIYKLMQMFTSFDVSKISEASDALKGLNLRDVNPKDIQTLQLQTIQQVLTF